MSLLIIKIVTSEFPFKYTNDIGTKLDRWDSLASMHVNLNCLYQQPSHETESTLPMQLLSIDIRSTENSSDLNDLENVTINTLLTQIHNAVFSSRESHEIKFLPYSYGNDLIIMHKIACAHAHTCNAFT